MSTTVPTARSGVAYRAFLMLSSLFTVAGKPLDRESCTATSVGIARCRPASRAEHGFHHPPVDSPPPTGQPPPSGRRLVRNQNPTTPRRVFGGDCMDFRDCYPHFPLLPGQPDRLLAKLHEAQTALTIAEHYVRIWREYPSTNKTPSSEYHPYMAHEALHEARDIIDCVVEELRIQAAGVPMDTDRKPADE